MKNKENKIFNRTNLDENCGLSLEQIVNHKFDDLDAAMMEMELEEKIKELFKLFVPDALGFNVSYTREGVDKWTMRYDLDNIAYGIVEKIVEEFCSYRKSAIEKAEKIIDERAIKKNKR